MTSRSLPLLFLLAGLAACKPASEPQPLWSAAEMRILESLSIHSLGDAPAPASNRFADDPRAVELGEALFFDTRLSGNGALSCASCHRPELHFTDGLRRGVGVAETQRNTPGIVGGAWQTWFYWDGRRDSLWSQALIPIEAPNEMGGSRMAAVRLVGSDPNYRERYTALFGTFPRSLMRADLPAQAGPFAAGEARDAWYRLPLARQQTINAVYANIGKAIAAWERTIVPRETAFDRYVAELLANGEAAASRHLGADAIAGAALFIDAERTRCLQCHNGPLLTNGSFHNIGTGTFSGEALDYGRMFGLQAVMVDEFNCLGRHSDAAPDDCQALRFLSRDTHNALAGAFKTPSLRNVANTAPYFHDGRFGELTEVMQHYRTPPPADAHGGHELTALTLSDAEMAQLVAFLESLSEPPRPPARSAAPAAEWSDSERVLLATFSLSALPPPRPDPGNHVYASAAAATLGAALFFDTGLSRDGRLSCASCHQPDRALSDGRATSMGLRELRRNALSLVGVAHNRWFYWDGRKDSLWSQALEPVEAPAEMGGDRTHAARRVVRDTGLARLYENAFGPPPALDWSTLPTHAGPLGDSRAAAAWQQLSDVERRGVNRVFTNIGKSIAAYERGFDYEPTRFDAWLEALLAGDDADAARQLSDAEVAGLRLFISGSTMCATCHNGPRFSNGQFHNIGTGDPGSDSEDSGRAAGREKLVVDEFNCASTFGDEYPDADCVHLETMYGVEVQSFMHGAFRTPGLRNLTRTAPYMHDGRFATIEDVLRYYSSPTAHEKVRHELSLSVQLDDDKVAQLAAFLRTLGEAPR